MSVLVQNFVFLRFVCKDLSDLHTTSPMEMITVGLLEKIESNPDTDMKTELPKTKIKLMVTRMGYILISIDFRVLPERFRTG
jgi:hypothetical protein